MLIGQGVGHWEEKHCGDGMHREGCMSSSIWKELEQLLKSRQEWWQLWCVDEHSADKRAQCTHMRSTHSSYSPGEPWQRQAGLSWTKEHSGIKVFTSCCCNHLGFSPLTSHWEKENPAPCPFLSKDSYVCVSSLDPTIPEETGRTFECHSDRVSTSTWGQRERDCG